MTLKGNWTDFCQKSQSEVARHDGDVYSPGLRGRYLQMPDGGEGDHETVIQLSSVLPEASGGGPVRYRELD